MNKAVFLDRDGVINSDIGDYTFRISDFKLLPGVIETMKIFRDKGYLLIVITNQGGIAKNLYGHKEVIALHQHLENLLSAEKIYLREIYYCPHHPVNGNCICRKPDSLMLEKAMARFNINPSLSYFIGDHDRDMEAGIKAGMTTIKVECNASLLEVLNRIR